MAVLTTNQIIDNIDSFVNNVRKLSKSYYMFVGRPNPWNDDASAPAANASVEQAELSVYRDIVYGKLIFDQDVSYMIRNVPWTNNTIYAQYSQFDGALIDKNFYVVTDLAEVYKCIYNNANSHSTVKPSLNTPGGQFQTSDGYIWKYMYTVDTAANNKFATASYIPVTVDTAVESSAIPGTIDYITLTDPGFDYQVYEEGFLLNVANNGYEVVLPNNAVQIDDYYTGSTIYLRAGGGAGQIRDVVSYSGLDRRLRANTPFTVYVNLNLENVQGTVTVGDTATQNSVDIGHYYDVGYFYAGNNIVQSDTGAQGYIEVANSSHFIVSKNNASNSFAAGYPFYNASAAGVLKNGNVRVIAGNNFVIANTGTAFTTDYAIGDYIKVGNNSSNTQIRRITAVNTTVIIVDANTPFAQTYTSNVHYSMPDASTPTSISVVNRSGIVSFTNIDGLRINISNTTPVGKVFLAGEQVIQVDAFDVNQGANAIISFSNSSMLELSDVNGTITAGLYVLGQSSGVKAQIAAVKSYPNITIQQPNGEFSVGQSIFVSNSAGGAVANAKIVSISTVPNQLTEYVISPKVEITGDGNGALAYAYVDTSGNNSSRQITEIRLINQGRDYTTANVVITSNSQYGSNATATAAIGPIAGHGSNTYIELGSKYAGISVTFANGDNESYKFPVSGEFRRVGILEDPTFNDATLTLDTFDRVKLYLGTNNGESFIPGEIAYQSNTAKAGVVVYSNSSYLELKNVLDTDMGLPFFTYNGTNSNTTIIGLTSTATAQILVSNSTSNSRVSYFSVLSNVESVSEVTTGATATVEQVISNTTIRVSNIKGHFNANDTLYDPVTNAYANVVTISIANGNIDATTDFGHKFNQTCRITLTSNTGVFQEFEKVTQVASNGTGTVLTFNNDRDLVMTSTNGTFSTGDILTSNTTGATAIVLYANSSYVKCTAANGVIGIGDEVTNQLSIGGTVTNVYAALVIYNVYNTFSTGSNLIVGANSGATGLASLSNTIIYPELVRNSGATSYLENIVPFERSNGSVEKINIVIKF